MGTAALEAVLILRPNRMENPSDEKEPNSAASPSALKRFEAADPYPQLFDVRVANLSG